MTAFELYLELKFECDVELSPESLSIISLLDYCQLDSASDFAAICIYSQSNIADFSACLGHLTLTNNSFNKCLVSHLNQKYEHINFTEYNTNNQNTCQSFSKLNVLVGDLDELNLSGLFDTTLPMLKRPIDDSYHISITGLAALYRDIVKTTCRIKDSKIENLLVTILGFLLNYLN